MSILLGTDLLSLLELTELKTKNRTMTCEDSLITATALLHGHTVATHNKRHFEPAGVSVIDPLACPNALPAVLSANDGNAAPGHVGARLNPRK